MSDQRSSPGYRHRNFWPIGIVVIVLLAATIVVWTQVLKPDPAEAAGCNAPLPPLPASSSDATPETATGEGTPSVSTSLGTFTSPDSLADIRPANPSRVPLRVLNASEVTGQAKTVTDELRSAGFAAIEQQKNDPLYPQWSLRCVGEIRYGYAGFAEARTVLLIAPCAQLVLDDRSDNSVDLALGQKYQVGPVSDKVREQLATIAQASAPPNVIQGHTVSVQTQPSMPPLPDRSQCPA